MVLNIIKVTINRLANDFYNDNLDSSKFKWHTLNKQVKQMFQIKKNIDENKTT